MNYLIVFVLGLMVGTIVGESIGIYGQLHDCKAYGQKLHNIPEAGCK